VSSHRGWVAWPLLAIVVLQGCGGGSGDAGSSSAAVGNVQAIAVGSGPAGQWPNMVTTSVTICVPGTSNCQTIANVQVDTGSSGLRLLASAINLPLPSVTSDSGTNYSECAGFADGVVWGALAKADVKLAGELAASVSLQVIRDNGVGPDIPASCSAQGTAEDSLALLGANGLLGVGMFLQDCGDYCASNADTFYYVCATGSSCSEATIPVAKQVSNPVAMFAQDNNGVILQLPVVSANGATSVAGNLIFGIGTQSNNGLSAAVIGVPDSGTTAGSFTALYRGKRLANSFFDSGSTGLYFDDAGIRTCAAAGPAGDLSGFYCPGSATDLSAIPISVTLTGSNGVSAVVSASVANAQFLLSQPGAASLNAFNDLAGPAGATLPDAFDFGVPFFFGRSVYTAFEQRSTSSGAGPYVAFQAYP
jgi:hypothetical protein